MDNIKDTVDIETIIKPVFNFKAADIYNMFQHKNLWRYLNV